MWHRAASVTTRHYHHAIKTPRCIVVGKILQGYSLSMTIYSICCHVIDILYVLYCLCILCANFNLGNLFMGIHTSLFKSPIGGSIPFFDFLKVRTGFKSMESINTNTLYFDTRQFLYENIAPVEGLQSRRSSLVKLRSLKYTYITSCTML